MHHFDGILSSPEPQAHKVSLWYSNGPASVQHPSALLNLNVSEARWPILIQFYLKHPWGRGRAACNLGADRMKIPIDL